MQEKRRARLGCVEEMNHRLHRINVLPQDCAICGRPLALSLVFVISCSLIWYRGISFVVIRSEICSFGMVQDKKWDLLLW